MRTKSSISASLATPMTRTGNNMTNTSTWLNEYEFIAADSTDSNNNIENPLNSFNATTKYSTAFHNESEILKTIEYIGTVLNFYYIPVIVGTGSTGNIFSVFVFFSTNLRKLSSSFYLAALAVSDTCFLLGIFAQWLNFVDVHIYNREYFCQFFTFFSNLTCFCSVWFVVAFTVERFIAVMYPLRRQTMCTVRRAKMVLVGLTTLGCLHCAPFCIFSTPVYSTTMNTTICDIKSEYKDYITLLNYWDTLVVFAVPFTTIAVLNTFTGCIVWEFATVRRTLTMQKMKTQHLTLHGTMSLRSSSCYARECGSVTTGTTTITVSSLKRQKASPCSNHRASHSNEQHFQHHTHPNRATMKKHSTNDIVAEKSRRRKVTNSSQLKVTKMLLFVSTVFVCLNLPSFIMRMITYLETQSSTNEKTTVVLQYIFQLLFTTNFAINFVLYCVSGQNFRTPLRLITYILIEKIPLHRRNLDVCLFLTTPSLS